MKLWIWILLIVAVGVIGYLVGRTTSKQVVDGEGKSVKGKFLSTDGKTATLQA